MINSEESDRGIPEGAGRGSGTVAPTMVEPSGPPTTKGVAGLGGL